MKVKTIILATGSEHKVHEIKHVLADLPFEVKTVKEVLGVVPEVVENAPNLEGNAQKKAMATWRHTGGFVLADDSGLFVDALGGAPGVHSARFAGEGHDDAANNAKLLKLMEHETNRQAHFATVLALVDPQGETTYLSGRVDGAIAHELVGSQGFGYDPLFYPEGDTRTFGQYHEDEKNAISHRGRALEKLREWLAQ